MEIVVLVGLVLFGLWAVAAKVGKTRRMRAAGLDGDGDATRCWMCGHERLTQVAEATYRCLSCGGVQGERAAALKEATRRAQFASWPAAQRREHARRSLAEAQLEFIAVEGELRHVLQLSVADIRDHDADSGENKLSRFAAAVMAVSALEQKLIDAAVVLASQEQLQRLAVDLGTMNALIDSLDVSFTFSSGESTYTFSGGAERRTHDEILRALKHLPALQAFHGRLTRQLAALEA
jgi:hypothetical protein